MGGGKNKKPLPKNQREPSKMEREDIERLDPALAEASCQLTFLPYIRIRFFLGFGFLCVLEPKESHTSQGELETGGELRLFSLIDISSNPGSFTLTV